MNHLLKPSLRDRLRSGTIFNVMGSGFTQGSTLVVNIAVARMLGQEVFGKYALIQSTLLIVAFIAQIATGTTATKYVAEFRSTDPVRTGQIMGICVLATIVTSGAALIGIMLGADWIARVAMKEPALAQTLRLGAVFVIFSSLNFFQMGALAGLESYPALARSGVISGIVAIGITVTATWFWNLNGAVTALLVSAIVRWSLYHYALRKEMASNGVAISYREAWCERTILWKFSMPAALSGFLTMPATWLANLFLVQQANGFSLNALYNAALNLKSAVMFLTNNVNSVGMSLLNNQKGLNDRRRYRKLYFANIAICTSFVFVVSLVVIIVGPYLLLLYGKKFEGALPVLGVLLLAALLETLSICIYQVIQSYERMWESLYLVALPISIVLPGFSYFWSPLHGALGLASSLAAATALHLVMTCLVAWPVVRKNLL